MAANYTALNYDPTSNQLPFYNTQQQQQQQQPSPTDSPTATPHNISPTSPRMETYMKYQVPSHVRQLRPPKSPLYVPAALRPTERPVRQSPMTPPKSLHGSLDSLEQADFEGRTGADGMPPFDLAMQQGFFPEEDFGEVTGPPNKDHWKVSKQTISISVSTLIPPLDTMHHVSAACRSLRTGATFCYDGDPFPLGT